MEVPFLRIETAYQHLCEDPTMIRNSFEVCGITSFDPTKVRNNEFYVKCMANALASIEEEEESDEDPFL